MATTTLTDTTSSEIAAALLDARRKAGSPAMGMVLTLVVVSDETGHEQALESALEAGREHPSRVLVVVTGKGRTSCLDAEVRVGDGNPGETVILRMRGPVARHSASVVRPLLLPDSPVVVYWPGGSPTNPSADQLGQLSNRRITDAMSTGRPLATLKTRAANYSPGDTDLTWTRLTPWRSLLAAALDQYPSHILSGVVEAERNSASANLLAAWMQNRLGVPIRRTVSDGPGITAARMTTAAGDIAITRSDGLIASYSVPGQPNRIVALRRRREAQLIAEELRRMDPDDIFHEAVSALLNGHASRDAGGGGGTPGASTKNSSAKRRGQGDEEPADAAAPATRKTAATKKTAAARKNATKKSATAKTASTRPAAAKTAARGRTTKKTATKKTATKKTATKKAPVRGAWGSEQVHD